MLAASQGHARLAVPSVSLDDASAAEAFGLSPAALASGSSEAVPKDALALTPIVFGAVAYRGRRYRQETRLDAFT